MHDSTGLRSATTLSTPRTRCESRLNNNAASVAHHATQHKAKKGLDFAEALFISVGIFAQSFPGEISLRGGIQTSV